ncbi:Gras family transcription factor family protein [Thalictrum thalictroides]|uniref:Gras family transcription factor family protein n=1 Tax=Thalictrum thalictroides TaxID=46969 RepID=A0A7J6W5H5_THATH|nr:Gras family transcription factor family protein [Thalictrum thalictroides]
MDNGSRNLTSNAVSFSLLPSELIEDIFLRLALPEIFRLKCVSKTLTSVIYGNDFRTEFNLRSSSDTWLFVYKKRSPRDSVLYGFTYRSNRWFKIPIVEFLFPIVPPGEDLYFLTASGGFFLFASNNCRELIAVNLTLNTVKKIPPSPLGPRGTSSWRRSGLKLIAGPPDSDKFRFLFAELYENRPVLFEYSSETDTWKSYEAKEDEGNEPRVSQLKEKVFLSVVHRRNDSILLAVETNDHHNNPPLVLRPRFNGEEQERLAIGFSRGNAAISRLHVYGDSCMVIVRSEGERVRVFSCIEVWGLCKDGRGWKFISKVPTGLVDKVRKPYGVMMGCLEERDGIVRVVLVTNNEGVWDLIWLCYEMGSREWSWVPLPEFRMKGLNMAGITISSGLTL